MYRERHHEKLSAPARIIDMENYSAIKTVNEEGSQPQVTKNRVIEHEEETSRPDFEDQINRKLSETNASTLIVPHGPQLVNPELLATSSDNGTQTSYASSSNLGFDRPHIPPLPIASESRSEFECPFCYAIISLHGSSKYRQWKRHVFKDLQPYMCTYDNCSSPNTMYDSRRQWIAHELHWHRREWSCNVPSHDIFSERSLFAAHMQQQHPTHCMEGNLDVVVNMCERAMDSTTAACPLCFSENAQNLSVQALEKHLGSHLEALALFALPRSSGHDPIESPNSSIRSEIAFGGSESSRNLAAIGNGSSKLSDREGSISERQSFGKPSSDHNAFFGDSLEFHSPNPASLEDRRFSALMAIKRSSGEEIQSLRYRRELSKTHEMTGLWFFESLQYREWKHRGASVLSLSGVPGSGKSNICANVVKDLENMRDQDSGIGTIGTAYLFVQNECSIQTQQSWICWSLLSQMTRTMPLSAMPDGLLNLLDQIYSTYDSSSTAIALEYLDQILAISFQYFEKSYIVIDAVDVDYGVAGWVFNFINKEWDHYGVRFFLTSRVDVRIWLLLRGLRPNKVVFMDTNSKKDIKRYLRERVWQLGIRDRSKRQDIIDKIRDRCNGVFTWAVEQVDALALGTDMGDRLSPGFLPGGVSELWRSMLLKSEMYSVEKALVASIFSRLYSAERPLTLRALRDSLGSVYEFPDKLSQFSIFHRCPAILQFSVRSLKDLHEDCWFEFIHPAIRIFLQPSRYPRTSSLFQFTVHEPDSHYEIVETCLRCLSYWKYLASDDRTGSTDYLSYAAQYWYVHLRKVDDHKKNELQHRSYEVGIFHGIFSFWLETYDPDLGEARKTGLQSLPTPLYYASLLGLPIVITRLLNQGYPVNAPGGKHNRPLLAGIEADSAAVVELLLSKGANCNARYKNKDTGLMRAIIKRNNKQCEATLKQNTEIVQRLLDAGANLELQSRQGKETALHMAVQNNSGDICIVQKLLDAGANIEARDAFGKTPLVWAAQYSNKNAVKILLSSGADVKVHDLAGNTVIHLIDSPMDILRLLAETGAPLNYHNDVAGYTPLHDAVERGKGRKVLELLHIGANIDAKTIAEVPLTALQLATMRYSQAVSPIEKMDYESIICRLLSRNASLEGWEDEGYLGPLEEGVLEDIRKIRQKLKSFD
ncbi:MAG: hypothetical protein Q9214_002817 [Letrouitia sp. 1 TL-2023]